MKKFLLAISVILVLIALAACGGNDDAPDADYPGADYPHEIIGTPMNPPANPPTTQPASLQIAVATDELLVGFDTVHRADLRTPGMDYGTDLLIWADQPISNVFIMALQATEIPGRDEWGYAPLHDFGHVIQLLPNEAFLVANYTGLGTLPHRGISFINESGTEQRVFFFIENQAYPEGGGLWIIQEIEPDRVLWVWELPADDYTVLVHGNPVDMLTYTAVGARLPTHIDMAVLWLLGLELMQGGSQVSLMYDGESIGMGLDVHNYLAVGADRTPVGIHDTFMADDDYFTQFIPLSLLEELGFEVSFENVHNRVHIGGTPDF